MDISFNVIRSTMAEVLSHFVGAVFLLVTGRWTGRKVEMLELWYCLTSTLSRCTLVIWFDTRTLTPAYLMLCGRHMGCQASTARSLHCCTPARFSFPTSMPRSINQNETRDPRQRVLTAPHRATTLSVAALPLVILGDTCGRLVCSCTQLGSL